MCSAMEVPVDIKILIIDFLDSYTWNIPAFLRDSSEKRIECEVVDFRQCKPTSIDEHIRGYDGIILSPGPGTVENPDDLGPYAPALLEHTSDIPILGVCLGFQAICNAFGGSVQRLSEPHHGIVADLVDGHGRLLGRKATRYHSLEAHLDDAATKQLEVLAYAHNMDGSRSVMEIRHRARPIWGVQYHPESVCSLRCAEVVRPFLDAAYQCSSQRRQTKAGMLSPPYTPPMVASGGPDQDVRLATQNVTWEKLALEIDLLEVVRQKIEVEDEFVFLESGAKGRWSILVAAATSWQLAYNVDRQTCTRTGELNDGSKPQYKQIPLDSVWDLLNSSLNHTQYSGGPDGVPFWGGFVGYFSYELGLSQLGLNPYPVQSQVDEKYSHANPDIHLLFANESILYDKETRSVYLMSLRNDQSWLQATRGMLIEVAQAQKKPVRTIIKAPRIDSASEQWYLDKVRQSQEHIKAGNSYELCMTAPSRCKLDCCDASSMPAADLFHTLRSQNPTEFMSLLRLGNIDFVSASPEEFMSFDARTKIATISPIKGTVPKVASDGQRITLQEAETELESMKIRAENRMIVDLTRNDLSKVSSNVTCRKLFQVDELETLYQLVSTVAADVDPGHNAIDVLRSSFPPGSMTGAPKRRSCEILQQLEEGPRGLYSGLVGFIDVRGNCRTSVSIRNAVKYPNEDCWRIGAGGAITSMSDPHEEWLERTLKAQSVLKAFKPKHQVLETMLWSPERGLVFWQEHMKRLFNSLRFFAFTLPGHTGSGAGRSEASQLERMSSLLHSYVLVSLEGLHKNSSYRISLSIDSDGRPSTKFVKLPALSSLTPVNVYLDPHTGDDFDQLAPFIAHKTTNRAHYESARARVGAQGRDEVLMFRRCSTESLLTEGSYTNVSVMIPGEPQLVTPAFGCLPGIERERLLREGVLVEGTIRREDLRPGMKVKLFNSVRGMFGGIIVAN
ncbi:ADC synthase [Polychaeton citri CBS 116435]|uniref:aminodeoxychorismate synthase n=1 Tax=Polychaeton citri CBS 116435 TaxID=1314669 RepID=A0A9P4QBH5_9PEZI|nr:ADC synthase [Polychaeton citri CBS 116435]